MRPNPSRRSRVRLRAALLGTTVVGLTLGLGGCEISFPLDPHKAQSKATQKKHSEDSLDVATQGGDPLGPKPDLGDPVGFEPPVPEEFRTKNGLTVWLVENRSLPMISMVLALPVGSAADPVGKEGVAYITSDMLDEGAGGLGAMELSNAVNDLGASLRVGATVEGSYVTMSLLRRHFDRGFQLMSDVIARPTFDPAEYKRVSELWENRLAKRADDPGSVATITAFASHYGPKSSYGHPVSGRIGAPDKISLGDAKAFYAKAYRPDLATLVVVGDIGRAEIEQAIEAHLGAWKAEGDTPQFPHRKQDGWKPPRAIVVDRADVPQSVITIAGPGAAVADPRTSLLEAANIALGGSFTSRLNLNLREEKNWTYGASSTFTENRQGGMFLVQTAVEADFTGPALTEIMRELSEMAEGCLTAEELAKVKAQDRADQVGLYGTLSGVAGRLGTLARLGLSPNHDASVSSVKQRATLDNLAPLCAQYFDGDAMTVVIVGPEKAIADQLREAGIETWSSWTPDGLPEG